MDLKKTKITKLWLKGKHVELLPVAMKLISEYNKEVDDELKSERLAHPFEDQLKR